MKNLAGTQASSVAEDVALQLPHGTALQLCKEASRLKHNQAFHNSMEKVQVLSVLSWDGKPAMTAQTEERRQHRNQGSGWLWSQYPVKDTEGVDICVYVSSLGM